MSDLSLAIDAYETWKAQQRYRDDSAEMFAQEVEKRLAAVRWNLLTAEQDEDIFWAVEAARAAYTEEMVFRDILEG